MDFKHSKRISCACRSIHSLVATGSDVGGWVATFQAMSFAVFFLP
jgi:hypothetical protein